jgi:hypothetical protein
VENIVAGNRIADHRRQAMYVLGSATTLASSMPQMWNRGLAPSYFNTFESNRTQNTATGCLVSARTGGKLLVDFPLALGNVVRQNSLIDNRFHGVDVDGARGDEALNIGSILEHNLVRNCEGAAFALRGGDHVVLRRNMAHFWRPPAADQPRAVFQFDSPGTWYLGDNVEEVSHVGKVRSMMERHTYKE